MKKLLVTLALVPSLALAQSTSVESGLTRAVPYVVGIGVAVSVIMLVFAGIKYTRGDPAAKEHAWSVFIGAALIMGASAIIGLMKTLFAS